MNLKMVLRIQSYILFIVAVLMLPSLVISVFCRDMPVVIGFIVGIGAAFFTGLLIRICTRKADRHFYAKEGMVTTGLAWMVMSAIGCLPFFISGRIPNYIDAFFEMVSSFTTTGASVVSDVEALGKGLLFWRSFGHWIGGMGILVFFLAIIPISGNNSGFTLHILRAESPGPAVNKMVPRMRDTAAILYVLYCALTVLDIILLMFAGLPVFDAFCIAFGTAGTGGFAVLNSGLAGYSAAAQWITTIFMLAFGINFGLYYLMVVKRFAAALKDEELRQYLCIVAAVTTLIFLNIFRKFPEAMGVEPALRHAAFQVASIITTTGYSTVDFDLWPSLSRSLIVFLMFLGASAGSTGGGFKNIRVTLLLKSLKRNAHQIFHPHEISVVRLNGSRVSEQTLINTHSYLTCYVLIIIVSVLLISVDGGNFSFETNFTAVMATFNNIGPGLGQVGPTQNFSIYNNLSTFLLSLDMLLGRLEIFPILAIFTPALYRKR